MAVPSTRDPWSARAPSSWVTEVQGGVVGSLSVLAVVLTLGLLAYASLGAAAPAVGLAATFVTAAIGGVEFAPWGEIGFQLGGEEGFKLVEQHEKALTAPGCAVATHFRHPIARRGRSMDRSRRLTRSA